MVASHMHLIGFDLPSLALLVPAELVNDRFRSPIASR